MANGLRDELKQGRPFRSLEEEALLSIVRTAAVFEHDLAQALRPYGITPTQYNVLRILRGAGDEGLCRNEVGERLVRRVPDVTRLLDRMEEMGLITRARQGADRRYVTTRIAAAGLALVERIDGDICGIHRAELGHLDEPSLRKLIGLLSRVRSRTAP
jgi:DNA-binding MarR family transcriptional regulator